MVVVHNHKIIIMLVWCLIFLTKIDFCSSEIRSQKIDRFAVRKSHELIDMLLKKNGNFWRFEEFLADQFEMDLCNRTVYKEEFIEMFAEIPKIPKIKYRMYNAFSHSTLPIINFTIHIEVFGYHYDVEVSLEISKNSQKFLYFSLANCHNIKRHDNFDFLFLKP